MKFISSLIAALLIAAALAFALANRQSVTLNLWLFDMKVEAPLYLLTLGTLILGLLLGAIIAWFSLLPHRLAARRLRKDLARLQDKIEDLQQTVIPPHSNAETPALPKSRWPFRRTGS